LRPGEKLYEEVLADGEQTLPTPHPKLRIARAREVSEEWLPALVAWLERPVVLDDQTVRRELQRWVAEYRSPSSAPAPDATLEAPPARAASGR
jgi:FlaA1/EpsC-like NDP-sugar epimerase